MANTPQSIQGLLQNRRDNLIARRVRATSKGDQLALDKEIESVDKLMALYKGRGEPSMSVDLDEKRNSVNLKPTTITARNKSKIVDDGRYSDITGPARNDLGVLNAPQSAPIQSAATSPQVSTVSPTQPISPAGGTPQMSKEAELANQYAANAAAPAPSIPSPEDLSIGDRVSLAVAGALNPQFFENIVSPQINARNPTPLQQQTLQANAEEIKSKKLAQIRAEGELQQNVLEREKFDYTKAQTEQELHAGFGHLAHEIMGSDGSGEQPDSLIQTLKAGAQQAHAAGLEVEANNLIRYAATLREIRQHDADYRKSIGMPPIPSGPADLQWFAKQAQESKAALDDVFGRLQNQRSQQRLIDATNAAKIRIPPQRRKEMDDWQVLLDSAQGVLGRRQLLGDIGGPEHFATPQFLYTDAMNAENADLSFIKGALGRTIGGGANLTKTERDELAGIYTTITDSSSTKEQNMQALIRFATKKLNGMALQYGLSDAKGDSGGNELDVERVRADGGVLVGHSPDNYPIFQMPNGELREVTP